MSKVKQLYNGNLVLDVDIFYKVKFLKEWLDLQNDNDYIEIKINFDTDGDAESVKLINISHGSVSRDNT